MAVSTPDNSISLPPRPVVRKGIWAQASDWLFRSGTRIFAFSVVVLIFGIGLTLFLAARPNLAHSGLSFLTTKVWDPTAADTASGKMTGDLFGVLPFVYGTLITSALALLIAVPLGVGAAIFLSEIAPRRLSAPISFVVELLAAVPSIVYGFWALSYLVPYLQSHLETWLTAHFGQIPLFMAASDTGAGTDVFAAGTVLALMVLPFITAISRDVLRTVPSSQREAAYGMGATKWEAIKGIVLRYASGGIIGAVMLGLGRAIGETMAVTIVIGNSSHNFPRFGDPSSFSLFRPGNTMTSLLANEYSSPNSPIHTAALTEIALTLFVITIIVNGLARLLVWLTAAKAGGSEKIKAFFSITGKILLIKAAALVFIYQIWHDVSARGIGGFFGAVPLIAVGLTALAVYNRRVPGTPQFLRWRKFCSGFALTMCGVCAFTACAALLTLLYFVTREGITALTPQFFEIPKPGDTVGMLPAIVGTGIFIVMASVIGIPLGVLGGVFLAEFGGSRLGGFIRFCADLLNGVPSIVVGIFAYTLIVVPTQGNVGIAGGFALGMMMIPTVMRTTEELLRLVPMALREGSLALGATRARTVWQVVLPAARGGIVTGILLAVARIAGETAPLLMVGCNSTLWNLDVRKPMASLPMQIYQLRDQLGSEAYHQLWGVALILVLLVLIFSLFARYFTRDRMRMTA